MCVRMMILFSFAFFSDDCVAQTDSALQQMSRIPKNFLAEVVAKISRVDKKISGQTLNMLRELEEFQAEVTKKIGGSDSLKNVAAQDEANIERHRLEFLNSSNKAPTGFRGEYNAYIDTLRSTLNFLQKHSLSLPGDPKNSDGILAAANKLAVLEGKLLKAEEIKKYLHERCDLLKTQLKGLGLERRLKQLGKANYYYTQYLNEYKDMLKSRKKLEKKAMSLLYSSAAFKRFVSENSILAGLFKLPTGENNSLQSLPGVQTRSTVQQAMLERINAGGPGAAVNVRQQIQAAQSELQKLKDKISKYGSADADIPNFKPNDQKAKTFLQRLEYGMNIQFGSSNKLLPATSDIAFTLGYKLNTNGIVGIGASYKIGLGSGWDNIRISSQGIGLRSYLDWKIGAKFYISGGYEQNYHASFKSIEQLKNFNAWQTSGLLGLSKKMQIRGKKNVKFQVMYDFFCYSHVPVTQPFVFRTGFSLK